MLDKVSVWQDSFGNDIELFLHASKPEAKNILLVARFHGDEPEGEFCLRELMAEFSATNYQSPYNIYILPCLNPSGKKLLTRANGHDIDLNRNYPTSNFSAISVNPHTKEMSSGEPGSEVETQIMMQIVGEYAFERILSIHSDLHLIDYDGPAKELASKFSLLCGYKLVDNIGYQTNGSFGTWAGVERKIPLITVETWHAQNEDDMLKIWQEIKPAVYDFCQISQKTL